MATPCDFLRTTKVEVNGITMRFHGFCAEEQLFGVVSAELFREDQPIPAIEYLELT